MHKNIPNLIIDSILYGSHEIKWDLSILLYKGAVLEQRRLVHELIGKNEFGEPILERLGLVIKIYNYYNAIITKGLSIRTVKSSLEKLFQFFKWYETLEINVTEENCEKCFIDWANSTLKRVELGEVKNYANYKKCSIVANVIACSIGIDIPKPGTYLMNKTRLKNKGEDSLTVTNFEENDFINFGWFLKDISDGLSLETIRGILPIRLKLRNGKELVLKGNLIDDNLSLGKYRNPSDQKNVLEARRALYPDENLLDKYKRSRIINLRIEVELFIFINQTGMNFSQAIDLKIDDYRWMTDNEFYSVFKVYKGRRQGEAIFKCFKSYRVILDRYIKWLKDVGFKSGDSLFPYLYRGIIKIDKKGNSPELIRDICNDLKISYYNISKIRKFRSNWFASKLENIESIKSVMSHSIETFRKNYERINVDKAIIQIADFHDKSIQLVKSSGAGMCASNNKNPIAIEGSLDFQPDCVSQEGCLFCIYHKDILSYDYFFRLATHAYIKELEMILNPELGNHPAKMVIDRINEKLNEICKLGNKEKKEVIKAKAEVRSKSFHPEWATLIDILEKII